jgi:hypothetical protein
MAAADFKFEGDDLGHRDLRLGVIGQHKADLHMATAPAQIVDRVVAGDRMAERVHRHMRAAASDLLHRLDDVWFRLGIDGRDRPDRLRHCQLVVGEVDGHDIGAQRAGDHDRRQPDAAAAMHRYPFAGLDAA